MKEIIFKAWKMRELKFRLYNPERKVLTAGLALNTLLLTTDEDFVKEFERCSMIWMQFTGLKDKNGVEIYEDDVVDLYGRKVRVQYKIQNHVEQGHGDCTTDTCVGFSLGFYGRSENFFNECEVIGNIHQNPDFLK